MRDRQDTHDRRFAFAQQDQHHSAWPILRALFTALSGFAFPQIRISDYETLVRGRPTHGFQSFNSSSRCSNPGGIFDSPIAAISASVKSSSLTARRSRRLSRAYSSAEMTTSRSRPFFVMVTASESARSASVPYFLIKSAVVTFIIRVIHIIHVFRNDFRGHDERQEISTRTDSKRFPPGSSGRSPRPAARRSAWCGCCGRS